MAASAQVAHKQPDSQTGYQKAGRDSQPAKIKSDSRLTLRRQRQKADDDHGCRMGEGGRPTDQDCVTVAGAGSHQVGARQYFVMARSQRVQAAEPKSHDQRYRWQG
jgi:hypothetical protein